jgi:hypothetical protein
MTLEELGIENDMDYGWVAGKGQPKWHEIVWHMWYDMHSRVKDPSSKNYKNYKDCKIDSRFDKLSGYVNCILSQDTFTLFESTCENIRWEMDKDMKVKDNRIYAPEYMTLCTHDENLKEKHNRYKGIKLNRPKSCKPVIGIGELILLFSSRNDVRNKDFDPSAVGKCCNGKYDHKHKKYKWYFINYKHNKKYRVNK